MRENIEIEGGEDVAHTKRSCGVAGLRLDEHLDDALPDVVCFFFESTYLRFGDHTGIVSGILERDEAPLVVTDDLVAYEDDGVPSEFD